ncbi:CBS domain-containing protein [Phytoactinopolyspora mesophila]|uniref:CBS domain-containing protein n=1 Tax=Phytoactinopolyspora mesophila TaxID=2650750 RepID=A0A7K3LYV7_9ACTN|nr:CBS domain-containing protein [Phytoactinopolyspora mesophila]NDL56206.1 CBS domain-containing protein [Phytoactinopolyspora mesophila]
MREHWIVADVMTTHVLTVDEETPFKEIVQHLADWRVSAVPVIDTHRRVLGVVSETDLLCKEQFQVAWKSRKRARRSSRKVHAKATGTKARELMTAPAITVHPEASLPAAARRMADHDVTRLIVVDDEGKLTGIVSRSDLIRVFLASDEELQRRVTRRIVRYALWDDPFTIHVEAHGGVVTLSGELELRSLVETTVRLTRTIDGVVDVVDNLRYAVDDTLLPPFHAAMS